MKSYFYRRNKYLIVSSGLFLGTLATHSTGLQLLGAGTFFYNYFERLGLIDVDLNPDMVHRKIALSEYFIFRLLKHHLLKTEDLNRWMTPDTLMLAKPITCFDDQGLMGMINMRYGLGWYKKQEFIMNVQWKDMKFYGEGTAYCIGKYTNMDNYYFTSICIDMVKPRKEYYVILDENTIDIS